MTSAVAPRCFWSLFPAVAEGAGTDHRPEVGVGGASRASCKSGARWVRGENPRGADAIQVRSMPALATGPAPLP